MLRLKFWIGGAIVALATTGIAMAAQGAKTDTPSATFSATAKRVQTRTCEGSDGTYKITRGVYEGKIDSEDLRLNGPVRIKIESFYNTDENAGWMHGELRMRNADTQSHAEARLAAVNLDGNVEGLLTGMARAPRAKLLANFSAKFTPDAFSDGELGQGASTNQALFFGGGCQKGDDGDHAAKPETKPERTEKPQRPDNQQQPEKDATRTR
jgi:hypothetical protein